MSLEIGDTISNFSLTATSGRTITGSDLKGKMTILYFYPKDRTPGCTLEGQAFRNHYSEFEKHNAQIFGVSRDPIKSHEIFKEKQCFPFELISDPEGELCKLFDVIKPKKFFGKEIIGIQRSTFLIDKKGILRREWRKVKVRGHAIEVLEALKAL